jgi:hypothetical protein
MSSPAHELALFLQSKGVGTFAQTIHVSREPVSPDNVVTLYDTGGSSPLLSDHAELRENSIQVRVRNTSYPDAYNKQLEIARVFQGQEPFLQGESEYAGVWQVGDIISIGRDDSDRFLLTSNYRVVRNPKPEES